MLNLNKNTRLFFFQFIFQRNYSTDFDLDEFIKAFGAQKVPGGFRYNSGENNEWETVESLRTLIKEHVDPNFSV